MVALPNEAIRSDRNAKHALATVLQNTKRLWMIDLHAVALCKCRDTGRERARGVAGGLPGAPK